MTDVTLIAHRGTDPFPDHSREAYEHAIDWGADVIEPDVQCTSDGVLVASHDMGNIPNLTYAQLKALKPGILTLAEVVDIAIEKSKETGRDIKISIETKSPSYYLNLVPPVDISKLLVKTLIDKGFTDPSRVMLQSFEAANLIKLHQDIMPALGVKFPLYKLAIDFSGVDKVAAYADGISVKASNLTAEAIAKAHQLGLEVHTWTHNSTGEHYQSLIKLGVDAIYTNLTRVAREATDARDNIETVYGSSKAETVSGTDGDNRIYAMGGDDLVLGGKGNDIIYGDGGNDVLIGGEGNDQLFGGGGNDVLFGGKGTDILTGGQGNDVIVATGADQIMFRKGDGIDLVIADKQASLTFENIKLEDIHVSRLGNDIVLSTADGDAIVLKNGGAGAVPAMLRFAEGKSLEGSALLGMAKGSTPDAVKAALAGLNSAYEKALALSETQRTPNLIANGSFENTDGTSYRSWGRYAPKGEITGWVNLQGGRIEQHLDTVNGIKSADGTYWTDLDGWKNAVQLAQTVKGVQTGATYQLTFKIADTDPTTDDDSIQGRWGGKVIYEGKPSAAWETITLNVVGGSGDGSNQLVFANTSKILNGVGVALDAVSLTFQKPAHDPAIHGTAGDDVLNGTAGGDIIKAGAGDDIIQGLAGNDKLYGGAGKDTIIAGQGDDTVDGGAGDDTLIGNEGNDHLLGGAGNDHLNGGAGNDMLEGGVGSDTYVYRAGDGSDTIIEGAAEGDQDQLRFDDAKRSDVVIRRHGSDIILEVGGETITLKDQLAGKGAGVEVISFADGTSLVGNQIAAAAVNRGPAVTSAATATGDEDTKISGQIIAKDVDGDALTYAIKNGFGVKHGTLAIDAATGKWTYIAKANYNGADGFTAVVSDGHGGFVEQRVTLNVKPVNDAPIAVNDAATVGESESKVFDLAANDTDVDGDALSLTGFSVTGVTGINLTADAVKAAFAIKDGKLSFTPGTLFDSLHKGETAKVTLSYTVNDGHANATGHVTLTINGEGTAANVMLGTATSDVMIGTDGDDAIKAYAGGDYVFGRDGADVIDGGAGNDYLYGGKGKDVLNGGEGHDVLFGGAGNDVLIGGKGNDILTGGAGADSFVFRKGFGHDTVTDFAAHGTGADHDVINLSKSAFADFAAVQEHLTDTALGVTLTLGDGSTLTLSHVTKASLSADDFHFVA